MPTNRQNAIEVDQSPAFNRPSTRGRCVAAGNARQLPASSKSGFFCRAIAVLSNSNQQQKNLSLFGQALIVTLSYVFLGIFFVQAQAASLAPAAARQALTGQFAGNTVCGRQVGIQLELKALTEGPGVLNLRGTLRTSDVPGQPKAPSFTTTVGGQLHLADGLLLLQNIIEPVDPCTFHLAGTCIVGKPGGGGSGTVIDDKMTQWLKDRAEKKRAEEIARATFLLAAGRNESANGIQGTIRGTSFDCSEFVLRRSGNAPTSDLPAITGTLALNAVSTIDSTPTANNSAPSRIYWLNLAANQGDVIAVFKLAQSYEMGLGVPKDMPRALKYYTDAGQHGDAQAQTRLSALYEKGDGGVAKDDVQSKYWANLAKTTIESAGQLCATRQFVDAYYDLFKRMSNDPNAFFVQMFAEVLTSTQVQEGKFRIEDVAPQDVSSVDRPFVCQIFGRSVGYRVESTAVPTIYAHMNGSGAAYYTDNSSDVEMSQMMAGIATAYGNAPVKQLFSIERLGDKHYLVTMSKLIITEYVSKSMEVTLP